MSDSDFSGSDSEDDLPSSNASIKSTTSLPSRKTSSVAQSIHRCAVSIDPPYTCPVPGCPKSSCKPWKTPASLHSHIADHALGKLKGTIPPEYFRTWNKEFCSSCYQIRKSFHPSQKCSSCSREKTSTNTISPTTVLPTSSSVSNHAQVEQSSLSETDLPKLEEIVKFRSPCLRYIPKNVRLEWSRAFTETLQDCIFVNEVTSYTYLFMLSKVTLRVPPSNIKSRKARDDFTLSLLKKWRGS